MTHLFQRIDTVFVPTKDMEKATRWYVDVLGGVPGWKSEQGEYQCVKFGDTSITLFLTEDPVYYQPRHCAFNFYVARASEAYDYLKSRDVQVEEIKEYGATYFTFYDVDGNCLEVCEY